MFQLESRHAGFRDPTPCHYRRIFNCWRSTVRKDRSDLVVEDRPATRRVSDDAGFWREKVGPYSRNGYCWRIQAEPLNLPTSRLHRHFGITSVLPVIQPFSSLIAQLKREQRGAAKSQSRMPSSSGRSILPDELLETRRAIPPEQLETDLC
jgi:hypothetical protein